MRKKSISFVFWTALAICTLFVLYGAFMPKQLETGTQNITSFIAKNFSWYYLLLVLLIFFVCVYLLFSRYASITLGEEGKILNSHYHLGLPCYLVLVWVLD